MGKARRKLKTLALALEFETEREAAVYIWETCLNGNYSFSHAIFDDLFQQEKQKACEYIDEYITDANELLKFHLDFAVF